MQHTATNSYTKRAAAALFMTRDSISVIAFAPLAHASIVFLFHAHVYDIPLSQAPPNT